MPSSPPGCSSACRSRRPLSRIPSVPHLQSARSDNHELRAGTSISVGVNPAASSSTVVAMAQASSGRSGFRRDASGCRAVPPKQAHLVQGVQRVLASCSRPYHRVEARLMRPSCFGDPLTMVRMVPCDPLDYKEWKGRKWQVWVQESTALIISTGPLVLGGGREGLCAAEFGALGHRRACVAPSFPQIAMGRVILGAWGDAAVCKTRQSSSEGICPGARFRRRSYTAQSQ